MEIDYDKDFKKVMTELQTNFGWSNIEVLPDSYRDLLNDTIKAAKNCFIHDVSKRHLLESILEDMDGKHPEYHREVVESYLDDDC